MPYSEEFLCDGASKEEHMAAAAEVRPPAARGGGFCDGGDERYGIISAQLKADESGDVLEAARREVGRSVSVSGGFVTLSLDREFCQFLDGCDLYLERLFRDIREGREKYVCGVGISLGEVECLAFHGFDFESFPGGLMLVETFPRFRCCLFDLCENLSDVGNILSIPNLERILISGSDNDFDFAESFSSLAADSRLSYFGLSGCNSVESGPDWDDSFFRIAQATGSREFHLAVTGCCSFGQIPQGVIELDAMGGRVFIEMGGAPAALVEIPYCVFTMRNLCYLEVGTCEGLEDRHPPACVVRKPDLTFRLYDNYQGKLGRHRPIKVDHSLKEVVNASHYFLPGVGPSSFYTSPVSADSAK